MDIFNLNKINKRALSLNKGIVTITELCEKYVQNPSEDNGIMMLGAIVQLDQDLNSIKKSVAELVNKIDKEVAEITKKGDGYRIEG